MSPTQSNDSVSNDNVQFKRVGYIYDIECMGNTHTATFLDIATQELKVFVVNHLQDDRKEYFEFLNWCCKNAAWCGFNNVGYDYPVVHKIMQQQARLQRLEAHEAALAIKKISDDIIKTEFASIREFEIKIPQVDLFKIKHYDGKAKRGTGLKQLEFVMQMDDIEDMPYHHTYYLQTKEELDFLVKYNIHDVKATYKFYKHIQFEIELRKYLGKYYNVSITNASEPRMSKEIFGNLMAKKMGIPYSELKELRTPREIIEFSKAIPDYISFNSKSLNALLKYFKEQSVKELKGAFDSLSISSCKDIIPYVNPITIKNTSKKGKFLDHLNIVFDNTTYFIGSGGIHGFDDTIKMREADEQYIIWDSDCVSMYPMLSIKNKYRPEHLGEAFGEEYYNLFLERKKYDKKDPRNYVIKIILNSSYGLSNEPQNFLYDPLMTISICLTGQLILLRLVEMVYEELSAHCFAANTKLHYWCCKTTLTAGKHIY